MIRITDSIKEACSHLVDASALLGDAAPDAEDDNDLSAGDMDLAFDLAAAANLASSARLLMDAHLAGKSAQVGEWPCRVVMRKVVDGEERFCEVEVRARNLDEAVAAALERREAERGDAAAFRQEPLFVLPGRHGSTGVGVYALAGSAVPCGHERQAFLDRQGRSRDDLPPPVAASVAWAPEDEVKRHEDGTWSGAPSSEKPPEERAVPILLVQPIRRELG